jgi:AraC-like DNA-binding protein
MAGKTTSSSSIAAEVRRLVDEFTRRLTAIAEADAQGRIRRAVLSAFAQKTPMVAVAATSPGDLARLRVQRAKELVEARYAEHLSLDIIAKEAGISKFQLSRSFHERVGLPLYKYLKKVRVAHAVELLQSGYRPSEVARKVGFADQPHLTRVFRQELGNTPRHYYEARGNA